MVHLYDFYSLDDVLQHHRGHPPPWQVWVFGLCDTSHTPARGVMRIVPDRSAATLLPIIQQHVRSGTVVHSDEWAAYNHVQHLPSVGQHGVGNHSLHFVDPATSVHTQHAESYCTGKKLEVNLTQNGLPQFQDLYRLPLLLRCRVTAFVYSKFQYIMNKSTQIHPKG